MKKTWYLHAFYVCIKYIYIYIYIYIYVHTYLYLYLYVHVMYIKPQVRADFENSLQNSYCSYGHEALV
jgi:hypothetical protein